MQDFVAVFRLIVLLGEHAVQDTEEVRAEARIHARLINDTSTALNSARPIDMEDLCQLVRVSEGHLRALKADRAAVLSHFSGFPKVTITVLSWHEGVDRPPAKPKKWYKEDLGHKAWQITVRSCIYHKV